MSEQNSAAQAQHTPGPWAIERPFGEPGIFVTAANPRQTNPLICKVYPGDEAANARLIAAAPRMLEENKIMREWLEAFIEWTKNGQQATPIPIDRLGESAQACLDRLKEGA